ncbi:hypothetical protein SGGMMB4_03833 [Sodalis glossinidius str. 'morsitans']|uniref:Uncharacterized protein n=1 Tax=Sodalis glossinidius (strain morsitans) TaxID=343509 RepID=A0A193QKU0_SODGM|nr:hypothetical protein SGGMMB4_03833 [Sodalis glossinidius str. 'morsitans']
MNGWTRLAETAERLECRGLYRRAVPLSPSHEKQDICINAIKRCSGHKGY